MQFKKKKKNLFILQSDRISFPIREAFLKVKKEMLNSAAINRICCLFTEIILVKQLQRKYCIPKIPCHNGNWLRSWRNDTQFVEEHHSVSFFFFFVLTFLNTLQWSTVMCRTNGSELTCILYRNLNRIATCLNEITDKSEYLFESNVQMLCEANHQCQVQTYMKLDLKNHSSDVCSYSTCPFTWGSAAWDFFLSEKERGSEGLKLLHFTVYQWNYKTKIMSFHKLALESLSQNLNWK